MLEFDWVYFLDIIIRFYAGVASALAGLLVAIAVWLWKKSYKMAAVAFVIIVAIGCGLHVALPKLSKIFDQVEASRATPHGDRDKLPGLPSGQQKPSPDTKLALQEPEPQSVEPSKSILSGHVQLPVPPAPSNPVSPTLHAPAPTAAVEVAPPPEDIPREGVEPPQIVSTEMGDTGVCESTVAWAHRVARGSTIAYECHDTGDVRADYIQVYARLGIPRVQLDLPGARRGEIVVEIYQKIEGDDDSDANLALRSKIRLSSSRVPARFIGDLSRTQLCYLKYADYIKVVYWRGGGLSEFTLLGSRVEIEVAMANAFADFRDVGPIAGECDRY